MNHPSDADPDPRHEPAAPAQGQPADAPADAPAEAAPEAGWGRLAELAQWALALCAALLVWGLLLIYLGSPLWTSDLFWHLATGHHFYELGGLPSVDPFAHTTAGRPWVLQAWLFQFVAASADRLAGNAGVRWFSLAGGLAVLAAALALLRQAKLSGPLCLAILVLVGIASWMRVTQCRPHLVTFACFFLFARGLYFTPDPVSRRRLAAFCALQVVWVNSHAVGLFGVLFYLGAVLSERLGAALRRRLGDAPPPPRLPLVGIPCLFGATLLTPNHLILWGYAFKDLGVAKLIPDEWSSFDPFRFSFGPDFLPAALVVSWIVIAACLELLGRLVGRARETLAELDPRLLAFGLVGAAAGFYATRFVWMWLFPLLAAAALPRRSLAARLPLALAPSAALALGLAFVSQAPRRLDPASYFSAQASPEYPRSSCDLFLEAGLEGRLFNHYTYGGYLAYRLYPKAQVFVDGRTFLHGRETLELYLRICGAEPLERGRLLNEAGVEVAFGSTQFKELLDGSPDWICVYREALTSVYLPRGPRGAANLAKVAAFYRAHGVPFDPATGVPPARR